jgi:hydroxyacylglutathione hydrolase
LDVAVQSALDLNEYRITTIVTAEPWKGNCYLVKHLPSGEQVLIDPGDDPEIIVQAVLDGGANLRHVLLTHGHHDHVSAVAPLCRRFRLPCNLHKGDLRLLHHAPTYALRFAGKQVEPAEPFRIFEDESEFQFGQQRIEVINTPGHTYGSVCYYFGNFIFTGDTLLYKCVGSTDLPGSDAALLSASVSRLMERLPEDTVLFPGHGRWWTLAEAKTWWRGVAMAPPQYNEFDP